MRYLVGVLCVLSMSWAQKVRARAQCAGPACTEKVEVKTETPRRRSLRRAETRVDRYGYPKPSWRAERFRVPVYSPRHKPLDRQEAFRPYSPSIAHQQRAERFILAEKRRAQRALRRAEHQRFLTQRPTHSLRAERYRPKAKAFRHRRTPEGVLYAQRSPAQRALRRAERQRLLAKAPSHSRAAERYAPRGARLHHRRAPERILYPPLPIPQLALKRAERQEVSDQTPAHFPRAERYRTKEKRLRHHSPPQGILYAQRPVRRHRPPRSACAPPPIPHDDSYEKLACTPPPIPHLRLENRYACAPTPVPHKSFDRYSCYAPPLYHRPWRAYERQACSPPPIRHKNFDRYACGAPAIRHRSPAAYDVPCDAQRQGVMTATERFAHDLRYIFTNHKKHCEVVSAYSGISIGEWVNTETYGRVPVAGYIMGKRVYVFAHFYDKNARPLKKPKIERRKVWALKQLEIWVPEPSKKGKGRRRYIKGMPGIEGFGESVGVQLVRKRLSVEETKAVQIEKLIRKRQIAWLVRAYPEERVRLPEWLKKYAGPKPAHFWPSVDYRLLEVW